jgi:hypothetical protein
VQTKNAMKNPTNNATKAPTKNRPVAGGFGERTEAVLADSLTAAARPVAVPVDT